MIEINKNKEFYITITFSILVGIITAYASDYIFFVTNPLLEDVLVAKVFFTSFNIVMFSALAVNYFKIYQEVPTSMARGLAIFSIALLFYAITSSPIVHALAGFEGINIGLFTYVPDMFASIAATILFYESYK